MIMIKHMKMHSMQIILVYVYVKRIALVMYVKGINVNITDSDSCPLIHLINFILHNNIGDHLASILLLLIIFALCSFH